MLLLTIADSFDAMTNDSLSHSGGYAASQPDGKKRAYIYKNESQIMPGSMSGFLQ